MAKDYWQVLDLRKRSTWGPYDDELIVLHLIPRTTYYTERYVVGRMTTDKGKTWFRPEGGLGARDVSNSRKHYVMEWIHLAETGRKEPVSWSL